MTMFPVNDGTDGISAAALRIVLKLDTVYDFETVNSNYA